MAKQASRPRASNIDDGTTMDGSGGSYFGNRFAKPTVTPVKLKFDKDPKKVVVNTFRLLPVPDPEAPGEFYPTRFEAEIPGAKPLNSDWIMRFPAFRGGDPGVTFFLYNPEDHPGQPFDDLKWKYPSTVLVHAVSKAAKNDEGKVYWQALTDGAAGKGGKGTPARLKYPQWMYLAYGLGYEFGGDELYSPPVGLDSSKPPVLFDLGADTGKRVFTLSSLLRKEYADLEAHGTLPTNVPVNKLFKIFDPIALAKGVFFRAFSRDTKDPRPAERKAPDAAAYFDLPPDAKAPSYGYEVYAVKTYNGETADVSAHASQLWKRLKPIQSQLIFPTAEEQVVILSERIKDPNGRPALDLFEYAFHGRDEEDDWLRAIPESVRNAYKGKVTSTGPKGGASSARTAPVADADDEGDEDGEAPPPADVDEPQLGRKSGAAAKAKAGKAKADASVPAKGIDDDEDEADNDEAADDDDAGVDEDADGDDPGDDEDEAGDDEDAGGDEDADGDDAEDEAGDDEAGDDDDEPAPEPAKPKAKAAAAPAKGGKAKQPMGFAEPPAKGGAANLAALKAAALSKKNKGK